MGVGTCECVWIRVCVNTCGHVMGRSQHDTNQTAQTPTMDSLRPRPHPVTGNGSGQGGVTHPDVEGVLEKTREKSLIKHQCHGNHFHCVSANLLAAHVWRSDLWANPADSRKCRLNPLSYSEFNYSEST